MIYQILYPFGIVKLWAWISSKMGCAHGARYNLLLPTTKWTGQMLYVYKQPLHAYQRISQNGMQGKGTSGLINPDGIRLTCLPP